MTKERSLTINHQGECLDKYLSSFTTKLQTLQINVEVFRTRQEIFHLQKACFWSIFNITKFIVQLTFPESMIDIS